MLKVRLNGNLVELQQTCTLAEALDSWGKTGKHFAVAINGDFVPRNNYESVALTGGEDLEVLSPMQGG